MIFSLDICRALSGDCFLLHFGSPEAPGLALIDGGPSGVYARHLKPRLMAIHKGRGLGEREPLPLDLLLVSHVDDDHIRGILDLTREMTESIGPPLVRVLDFWHNSFDDVVSGAAELQQAVAAQFGAASAEGELPDDLDLGLDEQPEVVLDSLKVLASIGQGQRLRDDARRLGFPLNREFDGQIIVAGREQREIANGLALTVAGPMQPAIERLRAKHRKWLEAQKPAKAPAAALAEYVDSSVPNLSSLVVLAQFHGKRILLTGDARGDTILEGLEFCGALTPRGILQVDVLKMPHHGSSNNVEADFFRRITADHYVFSGNGEYGNPERETLEMLFDARGQEPFAVHLTYPVDRIDAARRVAWEKESAQESRKKKPESPIEPPDSWSAAKEGLADLLARKRAEGQVIVISETAKPHIIDLLDRLPY